MNLKFTDMQNHAVSIIWVATDDYEEARAFGKKIAAERLHPDGNVMFQRPDDNIFVKAKYKVIQEEFGKFKIVEK